MQPTHTLVADLDVWAPSKHNTPTQCLTNVCPWSMMWPSIAHALGIYVVLAGQVSPDPPVYPFNAKHDFSHFQSVLLAD